MRHDPRRIRREVIKVKPPETGDSLHRLGTNTECGDTLVRLSEARNKKFVALKTCD
jgi:crotonobetainyl-CoA:carnitine CoA-transferase CaiB-like acyl-CoA transferase